MSGENFGAEAWLRLTAILVHQGLGYMTGGLAAEKETRGPRRSAAKPGWRGMT